MPEPRRRHPGNSNSTRSEHRSRIAKCRPEADLDDCPDATARALYGRMTVVLEPGDWPVWIGDADGTPPPSSCALPASPCCGSGRCRARSTSVRNRRGAADRTDDPDAPPPSVAPAASSRPNRRAMAAGGRGGLSVAGRAYPRFRTDRRSVSTRPERPPNKHTKTLAYSSTVAIVIKG